MTITISNIISNNETLAIELELSNKTTLTLATIYCPDRKPDRDLFRAVTSLSDKVILLGDFNSQHKAFNCATTATSGRNLRGIVKELKLIHLNNDEHTHLDANYGTTNILDMAFVTRSLKSQDIRFIVGESLGGYHLPIEIFQDRPLQRNIPITSARSQFAKADINTFQNKMEEIFYSNLFDSFTPKASDMGYYQKHLVDFMKEAIDNSIPKVDCPEKAD